MNREPRDSGIEQIGRIDWGTHLCQFYQTKEDLIDILVPYFKAGLENNEFCMWITSEPLSKKDAKAALKKVVKNVDKYLKSGQLEILDYSEWYTKSGKVDSDKILTGWVEKEKKALISGHSGLRISGNTFWLEKDDWKKFTGYEEAINNVIGKHKMLAICSYSLDKCDASEVIDVVANHQFAIIRRKGNWEIILRSEQKRAEEALRQSEEKRRLFMEAATDSFTIWDAELNLIEENKSSNEFLPPKMRLENRIGENMADMMPDLKKSGRYDKYIEVINTGEPLVIEDLVPHHKFGDRFWMVKAFKVGNGLGIITTDITERKQAEEALKASEENYKTIFNSTSDILFTQDPKTGKILEVNEPIKNILGYSQKEVVTKTVFDFLPGSKEENLPKVQKNNKDALKNGRTMFEELIQNKNGEDVIVEVVLTKANLKGKNVLVSSLRDITDRKRAEEALQESEEKFRLLTEQSLLGVIIIQDGLVKYANQAASNITGYSTEEALDWKPNGFGRPFHPDDLEFVLEQAQKKQQGAKDVITNYQYRIITKSGEVKWFDQYSKTIAFKGKSADFITIIDITERKHAEEALSHERDLMQTLFENSHDFIYFKDEEARFHRVSNRFCEFFKCDEKEIIGKTDLELFPKEVAEITFHEDIQVINTGKPVVNKEEYAAGTWVETTKLPWIDIDGKIIGLYGISHDITERKKITEELLQSKKLASVGQLAAGVAHELNNPLANISLISANMASLTDDPEIIKKLDAISEQGKLATRIVQGLLNFSRRIEPDLEIVAPNEFISEGLSSATMRKPENIDIVKNLGAEIPKIKIDPDMMQQVINNLTDNAFDAMPSGGYLTVTTEPTNKGAIKIKFADTGMGLSKEDMEYIFDPFFTKKEVGKGVGLGLSICHGIIEAHKGTLRVESQEGKGTTFTITLPEG